MADWALTYSTEVRVYAVNRTTWAESGLVSMTNNCKVSRRRDGLVESATFEVTRDPGDGLELGYYRIVLVVDQGARERFEIATLICESSGSDADRESSTVKVEGRSVLYPASVRNLLLGANVPKGADGAAFAANLLRACIDAPVIVDGSFTLDVSYVFDLGTTYLDAVWELLEAGNFHIQITGGGEVHIGPVPTEPELDLSGAGSVLLLPGTSFATDYSRVPNVYVADLDGTRTEAVNDDESSPVSTKSRGFRHEKVDESPKLVNGESLASYARRRLEEESAVGESVTYEREYAPDVLPGHLVRAELAHRGMSGDYRIETQQVELSHGATVKETAIKEVRLWTA